MPRSRPSVLALATTLTLAAPAAAHGAFGDFDPAFSGGSVATFAPPAGETAEVAWRAVPAPGGKTVVVGDGAVGSDRALLVGRLTPEGKPDPTFGGDGTTLLRLGDDAAKTTSVELPDVAVMPDGRVVVAAAADDATGRQAGVIARLGAGGEPDPTFDGDGKRIVQLSLVPGGGSTAFLGLTLLPDGGVVVAGSATAASTTVTQGILARFGPDGSPVTGFGTGGVVRRELSDPAAPSPATIFARLIRDPAGNFLTTGITEDAAGEQTGVVVSVTADGGTRAAFADGGVRRLQLDATPGKRETALGIALQPSGAVLVGGLADGLSAGFVARLTPQGDLDPGFANGGVRILRLGDSLQAVYGLGVQPDGRVLVPVVFDRGPNTRGGVVRLTVDGAFDPTFGKEGVADFQVATNTSGAFATTVVDAVWDPAGKVLLAGTRQRDGSSPAEAFVGRLLADDPPVAAIAGPDAGTTGAPLAFDASGSTDAGSAIASYAWDLDDDGAFDDATGAMASTSFASPGARTVRVRVTDANGLTTDAAKAVTVTAPAVISPPPPPPAAKKGGKASFVSLKVKQDAKGRALFRLRCPKASAASCKGKLTFLVKRKAAGSRSFTIAPGRTATVRVTLGKAARKVLGRKAKAGLRVRLSPAGYRSTTKTATVSRRPRR